MPMTQIKAKRIGMAATQHDVAQALDVSVRALAYWEEGREARGLYASVVKRYLAGEFDDAIRQIATARANKELDDERAQSPDGMRPSERAMTEVAKQRKEEKDAAN